MALSWMHAIWVAVAICSLIVVIASGDDSLANVDMVDIKPGSGLQTFEIKLADAVCRFRCKAQGGTNEQWKFMIGQEPSSGTFMCSVERESGVSYLFFEEFNMEFADNFYGQEFYVYGENGAPLDINEYVISQKEAAVHSNVGAFQSKLSKVMAIASRHVKSDEL